MKGAIAWFVKNHVAANLIMWVIVCAGIATIPTLTQELIPDIELEALTVSTVYAGASPSEVETSVTNRVEEAVSGLEGVKRLRSTSAEGMSVVTVELMAGEDVRKRLDEVRSAIDAMQSLPEEAEEPTVKQVELDQRVLTVAVAGETDERTLKRIAQQVRDEIVALPGVSEAELSVARDYEISIELSEDAMRRHGLTFDDVAAAVRRSSLDLPGGSIKADEGEILLRAKGQAYSGSEFENIALVSNADGARLVLGDVAHVIDGFAESDKAARFDGLPAVYVDVGRVGNQKSLSISKSVRDYLDAARLRMPEGIELTAWNDESTVLADRLGTMVRNARGGFLLVVLILALFLRLRLALWVSLGIPISFLGAVAVMPSLDLTVNFVSLLGFIVVLGIVVDDAIVVGENVHTHQQRTKNKLRGAIEGAQSIVVPVTFGVLTTVAAFAPLLFLPGPMGRMSRNVPIVVIACLLFSLFESMFILPSHLSSGKKGLDDPPTTTVSRGWRRFQDRVASGLAHVINDGYRPALRWTLEWRYLTLAIALSMLMVTAGVISAGWLKFVFMQNVEADFIVAQVTMTEGTPSHMTAKALARMEDGLEQVRTDVDAARRERLGPEKESPSVFKHVAVSVGAHPFGEHGGPMNRGGASAGHLGEIQVQVVGDRERDSSVLALVKQWRERVGDIPGAVELTYRSNLITAGKAIEIELSGHDLEQLRRAAAAVRGRLVTYDGVFDVADSFRGGKQELEYRILPSAEALGLTLSDLARQLRQAFHGEDVQTVQRERDEVDVVVRYPAAERRSLTDVKRVRIRGADGSEVPFARVAQAELGVGFSAIQHVDRRRIVTVTADVDQAVANANELVAALKNGVLDEVLADFPGVHFSFEGEQAEQRDFLHAQLLGMAASLLVIYALLAVPLGSYMQPLIIMSAIPFGFVGAAWGHVLLGFPLTMYSVIGLVALAGVVVNSSLVLVDKVNKLQSQGRPLEQAVVEAGVARFRPILLTSLTTFAGLSPMMLEESLQAQFMIPMAISIAFGVIFASFITLFLVPCSYLVLEDLLRLVTNRPEPQPEPRAVPSAESAREAA
jgi:multidrug efflux pump subunit AcrB